MRKSNFSRTTAKTFKDTEYYKQVIHSDSIDHSLRPVSDFDPDELQVTGLSKLSLEISSMRPQDFSQLALLPPEPSGPEETIEEHGSFKY